MEKVIQTKNEKPVFAKGWCFAKIFFMFFIGCIIGTYYEEILNLIRTGVWESRQGIIYGPFNPIYGFGLLVLPYFWEKTMTQDPGGRPISILVLLVESPNIP